MRPPASVRVRGIYATVLTALLLEHGFAIVEPSPATQARFGIRLLETDAAASVKRFGLRCKPYLQESVGACEAKHGSAAGMPLLTMSKVGYCCRRHTGPKAQALRKHPAPYQQDLNPDAMAGQNIGLGETQPSKQARTAYDMKAVHRSCTPSRTMS
jgi:hypothetical protein